MFILNVFSLLTRAFARFGEHDVRTEADGPHVDVPVARWEQHHGWNEPLLINDVAMVRLAQDIIFNGKIFHFDNLYTCKS